MLGQFGEKRLIEYWFRVWIWSWKKHEKQWNSCVELKHAMAKTRLWDGNWVATADKPMRHNGLHVALARKHWLQVCCINLSWTIGCFESTHISYSKLQDKLVFSVKKQLVEDTCCFLQIYDGEFIDQQWIVSAWWCHRSNAMELATFPSMCICCTHSTERPWASNVAWHMTHRTNTHMHMMFFPLNLFPIVHASQRHFWGIIICHYYELLCFILNFTSWCRIHFTQLLFTICQFTYRHLLYSTKFLNYVITVQLPDYTPGWT